MLTDDDKVRRVGRITASRMKDVLGKRKNGEPLQARQDYMAELVLERLTGHAHGIPMTVAMQFGIDSEPYALSAYEAHTGAFLETCAFSLAPGCDYAGASPDALVGADGIVEAKCPYNPLNHMWTLLDGMPSEHIPQIQCQLWVTGRQWCDFVSYDPRQIERLRLYVQRIERDDAYIEMMAAECAKFNDDVNQMVERLKSLHLDNGADA